jgi:hydrogenase maturation protease
VKSVSVICLGNRHASDDGAALRAADLLESEDIVRAGRPGAALLDLLDSDMPVVLVDVTRSGAAPGTIHRLGMNELASAAIAGPSLSSHGLGPGEALELGRVLGRPLPPGRFVGVEGDRFEPGGELSPAVAAALPALVRAIAEAVAELE